MATNTRQYFIQLGAETTTTTPFTVASTGSTGTPGALRTIEHPDVSSPIVTYARNPDRTINFLSSPLIGPVGSTRRTLNTTLPYVDSSVLGDVLVTEQWFGSPNRAAMTASFFKLLWEVFENIPVTGQFVEWDPKDLITTGVKYDVVVMDLRAGGRSGRVDAKELSAGSIGLDAVATGILDKTVEMDLLLRAVAT